MNPERHLQLLVTRARQGDRRALEQLLVQVQSDLRHFARKVCGTGEDAEDAVQETLLILTSRLSILRAASRFIAWSFTIIRNHCRQTFRRWMREVPSSVLPEARVDPAPDNRILLRQLLAVLEQMPLSYREVFVLRELEGLSGPEAALSLGISIEACKMRLHRAREQIRAALLPEGRPAVSIGPGNPESDRT